MQIAAFFKQAASELGVGGAYLITPIAGSERGEYGILRSFNSEAHMLAFYESKVYRQWQEAVAPLVYGEARKHRLHGMESFFADTAIAPPKWKMALLTWIAVNVAVYCFSKLGSVFLPTLPAMFSFLLTNALVVAALTWLLMPVMVQLLRRWLSPKYAAFEKSDLEREQPAHSGHP